MLDGGHELPGELKLLAALRAPDEVLLESGCLRRRQRTGDVSCGGPLRISGAKTHLASLII